ncbi:hypothetical protein VP01_2000g4 [Puccinia sorghi]|uniref:Uncharacterized protein n=1 Tax=Puccinia sorghi TaxID=27349 RepID=A0A0L6VBE3_9BASI|nr:hypothetical protein VP01_2000g4 [Puccinia sorghi]
MGPFDPTTHGAKTDRNQPANSKQSGSTPDSTSTLFSCSEAFAPLDEEKTLVFDLDAAEPAGYCKGRDSKENLACALRSCAGYPTCSGCSLVTSSATDTALTTDGKVIAEPRNCELAYYTSGKPSDPALCLTAQAEVLQCKGACHNTTSCSTCFAVTEVDPQDKSQGHELS